MKIVCEFITAVFVAICIFITAGIYSYKSLAADNIEALAYNCYFEARNSTVEDQIATMVTVMNRGEPHKEVYKKDQFSWTREYSKPADNAALKKCKALAHMVYNDYELFKSKDICKHYTAVGKEYGDGHWTKTFKRRTRIGGHWYYCN